MKKSQRLQRIANLSHTAEQVAAQTLARCSDEVARYAAQIRELEHYRDEYLRQFERDHPGGLDGYRAQKLRVFVGRIDEALIQLVERHAQAERRREHERAVWADRRHRTDTLTDVATRARGVEEVNVENALQREIDDRSRGRSGMSK
ncbi:MAG: flagellar FliJ family protein [Gammaproteobacteria bacterium]|nr:flagellar FliJ family protein [Gammaproteobacteria bacterium]